MPGRAKKAKRSAARHWRTHFARRAKPCPAGRRRRSVLRRGTGAPILRGGRSHARPGEEGEALRGAALAHPFCAVGEAMPDRAKKAKHSAAQHWHIHFAWRAKLCPAGRRRHHALRRGTGAPILRGGRREEPCEVRVPTAGGAPLASLLPADAVGSKRWARREPAKAASDALTVEGERSDGGQLRLSRRRCLRIFGQDWVQSSGFERCIK